MAENEPTEAKPPEKPKRTNPHEAFAIFHAGMAELEEQGIVVRKNVRDRETGETRTIWQLKN